MNSVIDDVGLNRARWFLLTSSCFSVNVGIVLPFVVDLGMQPNEDAEKLAQGQLFSITDLALTFGNSPVELFLFLFCKTMTCHYQQ